MRSVAYAAIAATLAVAAAATPALAQQAPFTGLRAEGLVGWDRSQANDHHNDGVAYGAAVGYDMQMSGFVVGAEGEIDDSTTKGCDGPDYDRFCANAGRDLYVGGRIGKVIGTGRTLVYAKAGYTNARFSLREETGGLYYSSYHDDLDGFRLGAGAEYAVGPNSFVKAEYRYSNYEQGVSRNQVVAGFGFRF